eukprot:CAMPEP_0172496994 /NCGR_PEP_ID=MMETSP1066-20121228/94738_1 /TAXON_ID=671091 /ORGANISM="Coscinodiscus wailesii, Strain CCMP2513" /LENGTH=266 /DNA_ID=CAMNT_0013269563 /DNA_START=53 /DNA_END=850 /DNA_ORIENTATION=+
MNESTLNNLRSLNWKGSIPIILTLAPTSLSSPTMPPPQHHLISRLSYLHISLREAILRLYKFAAPSMSIKSSSALTDIDDGGGDGGGRGEEETTTTTTTTDDNDGEGRSVPQCWFEDDDTKTALRWQFFVGVLYDMILLKRKRQFDSDGGGGGVVETTVLPWKLRVHFTSYPSHQILSLGHGDVIKTVEKAYSNSLKQALFLQHGSSKIAMGMTKTNHELVWDAVVRSNFNVFSEASRDLWGSYEGLKMLPVRILVGGKPAVQRVL